MAFTLEDDGNSPTHNSNSAPGTHTFLLPIANPKFQTTCNTLPIAIHCVPEIVLLFPTAI